MVASSSPGTITGHRVPGGFGDISADLDLAAVVCSSISKHTNDEDRDEDRRWPSGAFGA